MLSYGPCLRYVVAADLGQLERAAQGREQRLASLQTKRILVQNVLDNIVLRSSLEGTRFCYFQFIVC